MELNRAESEELFLPNEQSHIEDGFIYQLRKEEPPEVGQPQIGLLDSILQQHVGEGSISAALRLQQFLNATSLVDAIKIWLGRVPAGNREFELARRAIARDIGRIDRLLSGQVNEILHHPSFQSLESAWRGLDYLWQTRTSLLTGRVLDDKAADIEIRILSVSKKELVKDFEDAVDFDQNNLIIKNGLTN